MMLLLLYTAPSLAAAMPVPRGNGGAPGHAAGDIDGSDLSLKSKQCEASPDHDGCIDLLYALAQTEESRGELEIAERHASFAITTAHQQGGFARPDIEKFYILLATIVAVQGRTDEAEFMMMDAIAAGRARKWQPERIGKLNCRAGKILADSLAHDRAMPLFRAGLKMTSAALTNKHIDYRVCGLWAMMSFYRQGRLDIATEIATVLMENKSQDAAQFEIYSGVLLVSGHVLFKSGRNDEAERALRTVFLMERTSSASTSFIDSAITLSAILVRRQAAIGEARTISIAAERVILNQLRQEKFDKRAEVILRRNRHVFETRVRVNWAAAQAGTELVQGPP
ncbi:hypothetical protein [Sphingomonas sp.]|uniref:hypothetical protein n=1 Tax=Sphingomonas sp. TaxID=28214 RepID=UPI002E0DE396|nr:hypothetical protein [Sphingomonas sp.]